MEKPSVSWSQHSPLVNDNNENGRIVMEVEEAQILIKQNRLDIGHSSDEREEEKGESDQSRHDSLFENQKKQRGVVVSKAKMVPAALVAMRAGIGSDA